MKQSWKMHFYKGNPCTWEGDPYDEERDNYVFDADLYIRGTSRGCSSAVMILVPFEKKDQPYVRGDIQYQVFMSDVKDIVEEMVKGRVQGKFTWAKKGSNYGLRIVK